jgi:lipopolysaccharide export system ATP-binding protein
MSNRSILEVVMGAVSHSPKVLVLDEPFNGLKGPLPKQAMIAVLKACRDAGTAVMLADHDIRAALQIVDRAYLVHRGKIMAEGDPDELLGQPPD